MGTTNNLMKFWEDEYKKGDYFVEKGLNELINKSNNLLGKYDQTKNKEFTIKNEEIIDDKTYFEHGEYKFEPDSSPIAWKYYDIIYCDFIRICPKVRMSRTCNKGYSRLVGYFELKDINSEKEFVQINHCKELVNNKIHIAGDCVFNFGNGYKYYKAIIEEDPKLTPEEKQRLLVKLELCKIMHHSPYNFSLMPVTGGLNNFKGRYCKDRPDIFIYYIKEYEEYRKINSETSINHKIFSYAIGKNSKEKTAKENAESIKCCLKVFLIMYFVLKKNILIKRSLFIMGST